MSELGSIARVSGSVAELAESGAAEGPRGATAGGIPSPELPRQEPFTVGKVIEVVTIFHDAIVDTRHFSPPERRDLRRRALILLISAAVASGAALVMLVLAFARVRMLSLAFDIGFFALFVAGIAIFTWGMVRRFEARAPRDFTIGTAPDALFPVPAETLSLPRFPLLAADGEGHLLQLLDGMKAELSVAGQPIALAEIDDAVASKSAAGARAIRFVDGMEARIVLGSITFLLRHTDGARRESTTSPADPAVLMTQAGAFALFMIAMTILHAMPRPQRLGMVDTSPFVHVSMDGWAGRGCVGPICGGDHPDGDRPKGAEGRRGPRRKGTADLPPADPARRSSAISEVDARVAAEERARRAGVLAILETENGRGALDLGDGSALGDRGKDLLSALHNDEIDNGWGAGGLGLVGISEGGGGDGAGTIGLGNFGTIGRGGTGTGSGWGYGRGIGSLGGRRAGDPSVRIIAPTVQGSLDKEIVRRVIRRHTNEARYCFERELQRDPDLHEAKVKVQFAISGSGKVISAFSPSVGVEIPAEPSPLSPLEKCVQDAVRRWEFPTAQGGGLTIVNYPFAFHTAGE